MQRFELETTVRAAPQRVWAVLTEPAWMTRWMGEPEMQVEVETTWTVGGPIRIRGHHHARFENRGLVLDFAPQERLRYSHVSSLSRLPDVPESYSVFDFRIAPSADGVLLKLTVSGFPTESIYRHLAFYWRGTLALIKRTCELPLSRAG